ncbi:MAG: transposase [Bacteroidetes bacterium]|nr:transposase [Bacteroidota bacterium]
MDKSKELNIEFEQLNIQPEHVHALIDLPTDDCLSNFMQNIKGGSSYWINDKKILKSKFSWQRGYGAYSVSASQLQKVKNYIKNQTEHYKQKTFTDEYNDWVKEYGVFDD